MKQIVVISGKGGTGKTTIVASLAALAKNAVIADCDVDAPDLHLLLRPEIKETREFRGSKTAIKDDSKCIKCRRCEEVCRFDAIKNLSINSFSCEGCGACVFVCPVNTIELKEKISGYVYVSETKYGPMSHAKLNIGGGASGKLVAVVKENAKKIAEKENRNLILIDGSPGIGCPVIASLSGADIVLIVTEPTMSGIHDLKRILSVAEHFNIKPVVCVNKYDINLENSNEIMDICRKTGIEIAGKIPFNPVVTRAMIAGKSVVEFSDDEVSDEIKSMWNKIKTLISNDIKCRTEKDAEGEDQDA